MNSTTNQLKRRTILKGAAWATPVIAAAAAAPLTATSPGDDPTCPDCAIGAGLVTAGSLVDQLPIPDLVKQPVEDLIESVFGAGSSQLGGWGAIGYSVPLLGKNLSLIGGFGLNATDCTGLTGAFDSDFNVVCGKATLTMNGGGTLTSQEVGTKSGLTLGVENDLLSTTRLTFNGPSFPDGSATPSGTMYPYHPTKLTIPAVAQLRELNTSTILECDVVLTWDLNTDQSGGSFNPVFGAMLYGGTASAA